MPKRFHPISKKRTKAFLLELLNFQVEHHRMWLRARDEQADRFLHNKDLSIDLIRPICNLLEIGFDDKRRNELYFQFHGIVQTQPKAKRLKRVDAFVDELIELSLNDTSKL